MAFLPPQPACVSSRLSVCHRVFFIKKALVSDGVDFSSQDDSLLSPQLVSHYPALFGMTLQRLESNSDSTQKQTGLKTSVVIALAPIRKLSTPIARHNPRYVIVPRLFMLV